MISRKRGFHASCTLQVSKFRERDFLFSLEISQKIPNILPSHPIPTPNSLRCLKGHLWKHKFQFVHLNVIDPVSTRFVPWPWNIHSYMMFLNEEAKPWFSDFVFQYCIIGKPLFVMCCLHWHCPKGRGGKGLPGWFGALFLPHLPVWQRGGGLKLFRQCQ